MDEVQRRGVVVNAVSHLLETPHGRHLSSGPGEDYCGRALPPPVHKSTEPLTELQIHRV